MNEIKNLLEFCLLIYADKLYNRGTFIHKGCKLFPLTSPKGHTEPASKSEVNEFDFAARFVDAHDILRLEVQVNDAFLVDEIDAVYNLQHVFNHLSLRQLEILVDNALKQLSSRDPAQHLTINGTV